MYQDGGSILMQGLRFDGMDHSAAVVCLYG